MVTIDAKLSREPFAPERLPSIASQKRVAPLSPTMRSAPLTWCRCSGHMPSTSVSSGDAENLAMLSRTCSNAWSTSAVIQERMVASAMVPVRRA